MDGEGLHVSAGEGIEEGLLELERALGARARRGAGAYYGLLILVLRWIHRWIPVLELRHWKGSTSGKEEERSTVVKMVVSKENLMQGREDECRVQKRGGGRWGGEGFRTGEEAGKGPRATNNVRCLPKIKKEGSGPPFFIHKLPKYFKSSL